MKLVLGTLLCALLISCGSKNDDNAQNDVQGDHNHGSSDLAIDQGATLSLQGTAYASLTFEDELLESGRKNQYNASLLFFDKEGRTIPDSLVTSVQPWMRSMGHGSFDEDLKFEEHGEMQGHWIISGIVFSMAGDAGSWVIKVKFSVAGASDEVIIPVPKVD